MSAPTAEVSRRRDRLLRRLIALLNVTQDLDRNQEDTLFAQAGGEIIYCFDQPLIEAFLRPAEKFRIYEGFHGQTWSEDWAHDKAMWKAVSAQSALVGSKWLFSGQLIGQQARRIYMSEWHLREFFVRYEKHKQEIERQFASASNEQLERFLKTARVLVDDPKLPLQDKLARAVKQHKVLHLRGDIAALQKQTGASPDVAWRFALSRLAASVLARDEPMQRVQYLHELHAPDFVRRLSPIHTRFQARTDAERAWVRECADDWHDRLTAEQERRQKESTASHSRPTRNFRADAMTIAYLQWIAETQLTPNQRIVLISGGDELLLNAHRRWRIEDPARPHLIRRGEQYAPMYNFNDSPNDLSRRKNDHKVQEVFKRTRAAVEISLAPMNLSAAITGDIEGAEAPLLAEPPRKANPALENGRQFLAWFLAYTDQPSSTPALLPFLHAMSPEWVAERTEQFDKLRNDWQELERARLGVSYDELRAALDAFHQHHTRLTKLKQEMQSAVAEGARLGDLKNKEAARTAFSRYVGGLLDEITANSIGIWMPLAIDFVRAASSRTQFRTRRKSRVPIALQLRLPVSRRERGSDGRYDLVDVIESWIAGGKQRSREITVITSWARSTTPPRPDVIFAVAAALALRLGHWSDAGFFAQLALNSALKSDTPEAEENRQEYVYLHALTRRLRMGSRAPQNWKGDRSVWRTELEEIVADLDESQSYYEQGKPSARDRVRMVRAMSERAAVRIFFATWAISFHDAETGRADKFFEQWRRELELAAVDLARALEALDALASEHELDAAAKEAAARLEKQVNANWAATVVLCDLARRVGAAPMPMDLDKISDRVRANLQAEHALAGMPPVSEADVFAFKFLQDRDPTWLHHVRRVATQPAQPRLPVDDALFQLLLKHLR